MCVATEVRPWLSVATEVRPWLSVATEVLLLLMCCIIGTNEDGNRREAKFRLRCVLLLKYIRG